MLAIYFLIKQLLILLDQREQKGFSLKAATHSRNKGVGV